MASMDVTGLIGKAFGSPEAQEFAKELNTKMIVHTGR